MDMLAQLRVGQAGGANAVPGRRRQRRLHRVDDWMSGISVHCDPPSADDDLCSAAGSEECSAQGGAVWSHNRLSVHRAPLDGAQPSSARPPVHHLQPTMLLQHHRAPPVRLSSTKPRLSVHRRASSHSSLWLCPARRCRAVCSLPPTTRRMWSLHLSRSPIGGR